MRALWTAWLCIVIAFSKTGMRGRLLDQGRFLRILYNKQRPIFDGEEFSRAASIDERQVYGCSVKAG